MEDDPSVLAGTFKSRRLLGESETALEDLLDAFREMSQRLKSGEAELSNAELSKAKSSLAQARLQIVDEVTKHEKRILQSRGLVADAPLDFGELRTSIGRKLNRIRDTRGTESVSGEPFEQ